MGGPLKLAPAAYWEIRARVRDVEAIELDLLKQRLDGQRRLAEAKAAVTACLDRWQVPDRVFGWNDETQELIPAPTRSGGRRASRGRRGAAEQGVGAGDATTVAASARQGKQQSSDS